MLLLTSEVSQHSHEHSFTASAWATVLYSDDENHNYEITVTYPRGQWVNTLRPRQDGRYFADDVLKCIFWNENVWIWLKIPLKFVPRGPINNIPALVQIMAWRRPGDKPLSEPMLVFVPTHICVTRPQWVKKLKWHRGRNFTQWRFTTILYRVFDDIRTICAI